MTDQNESLEPAATADPEIQGIVDSLGEDAEEPTVETEEILEETPEMVPPLELLNVYEDEEEDDPTGRFPWKKAIAGILGILLLVLLVWGIIAAFVPDRPTGSSGQPDGTAANALLEPDGPVEPAISTGVTSWTTWAKTSLTNSDMESSMIEAHDVRYHKYLKEVLEGEKTGKSYKKLFPKGTRFINSDYNVVNDGKYVFFWDTLEQDTWFLTFPDGTPAVKMTCGNTIIIPPGKPEVKKSGAPPTVTKPSIPVKETKGPDTTGGAARQPLRDGNAVLTTTPGYTGGGSGTTGGAEEVVAKQTDQTSTGNNGQAGHVGTGSGGTTADATNSSGETNEGGGASDTSLVGGVETPATGDTGAPN